VWLPHDAKAKTLQTGRSIVEQFISAKIIPKLVPNLDVLDGIAAARMLFPEIWFNEMPCEMLIEALKTYRRAWDEDKKAFSNQPIHDWSSHYADVFRYFAIVAQKTKQPNPTQRERVVQTYNHYPYSLDDLYEGYNNGNAQSRRTFIN